jgi:hypothetical protein
MSLLRDTEQTTPLLLFCIFLASLLCAIDYCTLRSLTVLLSRGMLRAVQLLPLPAARVIAGSWITAQLTTIMRCGGHSGGNRLRAELFDDDAAQVACSR